MAAGAAAAAGQKQQAERSTRPEEMRMSCGGYAGRLRPALLKRQPPRAQPAVCSTVLAGNGALVFRQGFDTLPSLPPPLICAEAGVGQTSSRGLPLSQAHRWRAQLEVMGLHGMQSMRSTAAAWSMRLWCPKRCQRARGQHTSMHLTTSSGRRAGVVALCRTDCSGQRRTGKGGGRQVPGSGCQQCSGAAAARPSALLSQH